jgi:hypothetical protein
MCGATDCPSCGPAQGYNVERRWVNGQTRWVNPEDYDTEEIPELDSELELEPAEFDDFDCEVAANDAEDRDGRDRDARQA